LATPITTRELLVGKVVAAIIPASIIGWISYSIAVLGMWPIAGWPVTAELARPVWSVGIAILSPMLALVTALLGTMASAKAKDVRAAQGVAALAILPVMGIGIAILILQIYLDFTFIVVSVTILIPIAWILFVVAQKTFDREQILTKLG
jgi:ABC-2 type transport system permease protein